MSIPDYQSILLPLLKLYAERGEVSLTEAIDATAAHFVLTEADRAQPLPSGRDNLLRNRVEWARQYLVYATLVRPVRHGVAAITELGQQWAAERTAPLKVTDFKVIPGYEQRLLGSADGAATALAAVEGVASTPPLQRLEDADLELRQAVIVNLMDRVLARPPVFFERLVMLVMARLGYGDGTEPAMRHAGRGGDHGADATLKTDVLGVDEVRVHARRGAADEAISREQVAAFAGSIAGVKGVFVTTSSFSRHAVEFARASHPNVALVDGQKLGELMLRCKLGVSVRKSYEVFDVDEDFFSDDE